MIDYKEILRKLPEIVKLKRGYRFIEKDNTLYILFPPGQVKRITGISNIEILKSVLEKLMEKSRLFDVVDNIVNPKEKKREIAEILFELYKSKILVEVDEESLSILSAKSFVELENLLPQLSFIEQIFEDGSSIQNYLYKKSVGVLTNSYILGENFVNDIAKMGIGFLKVCFLGKNIDKKLQFPTNVKSIEGLSEKELPQILKEKVDLWVILLEGFYPKLFLDVNKELYKNKIPLFLIQLYSGAASATIGPYVDFDNTGCLYDFYSRYLSQSKSPNIQRLFEKINSHQSVDIIGQETLSYLPFIRNVTGFAFIEILKVLTNVDFPITANGAIFLDLLNAKTEFHPLLKLPRCPICKSPESPEVSSYAG